jgi:hypothetical protein
VRLSGELCRERRGKRVCFRRFCSFPSLLRPILTISTFSEIHVTASHLPTHAPPPPRSLRRSQPPFPPHRPPRLASDRRSTALSRSRHSQIDIRTLKSLHRRSEGRRGRNVTSRPSVKSKKKSVFPLRPFLLPLSRLVKVARRLRLVRCRKVQERNRREAFVRGRCCSPSFRSVIQLCSLVSSVSNSSLDGQLELT